MDIVRSKNGVHVRLTDERWAHITEEHNEMAGYYFEVLETISEPESIYQGRDGECIAVKAVTDKKFLVVIYRELEEDGFVITAFLTKKVRQFEGRTKLWP